MGTAIVTATVLLAFYLLRTFINFQKAVSAVRSVLFLLLVVLPRLNSPYIVTIETTQDTVILLILMALLESFYKCHAVVSSTAVSGLG